MIFLGMVSLLVAKGGGYSRRDVRHLAYSDAGQWLSKTLLKNNTPCKWCGCKGIPETFPRSIRGQTVNVGDYGYPYSVVSVQDHEHDICMSERLSSMGFYSATFVLQKSSEYVESTNSGFIIAFQERSSRTFHALNAFALNEE